jgi:hypothetical protein
VSSYQPNLTLLRESSALLLSANGIP